MANVIAQSGQGGTASASLIRQWTATGGDPNSYYGVWTDYYEEYTITATPDAGYSFAGWTIVAGNGSTSSSSSNPITRSLRVKSHDNEGDYTPYYIPYTYTANFTPNQPTTYTVTTDSSPAAGGTTTGGGQYASGSMCTVTATPAQGYEFVRWILSTGASSTSKSYSFRVTRNTTATAYFRQLTHMPLHGSSGTLLHGSSGTLLHDS